MFKSERKIIEFCEKHYMLLGFIIISVLALLIRVSLFKFESGDYVLFLKDWFNYLKANGGFWALKNYPGDYNAPYMTIMSLLTYIPINSLYSIKIVSVFFDFVLAVASAALVKEIIPKNKKFYSFLTYCIVLFLPTVVLNSALWGQCDCIYASFVILSLLYLIKEKYIPSFILLGIAFSFKLQFMFILPLYVVLYIVKKKHSILHFLIIPLTNMVMCIPALIAGKSLKDLLFVYLNQTSEYSSPVLNFSNIYNYLPIDNNSFGMIIAVFICALMLIYIIYKKVKFDNMKIITLGLWFVLIMTFVLPSMHERYAFVAEILLVIYFILNKENLPLLLFTFICTIVNYSSFLFRLNHNLSIELAIINTILLGYFTRDVILKLICDKENVQSTN